MTSQRSQLLLVVPSRGADHHHGHNHGPAGTAAVWRDFDVVQQGLVLPAYQLYAVEQWLVDRQRTDTIVHRTNNPSHKIIIDVIRPRGASYEERKAVWDDTIEKAQRDGARPKHTELGVILAVDLTEFPQSLGPILIPDGCFASAKESLYINVNLRRLGAGNRKHTLSLSDPSASQQERLKQLYKLPDSAIGANFSMTVLRLVSLAQAALSLFDLGPNAGGNYSEPDGLLCDVTVNCIMNWRLDVAHESVGPDYDLTQSAVDDSCKLPPDTLASLLSVVICTRNRLMELGVNHVPSDPFVNRASFVQAYKSFLRASRQSGEAHYLTRRGIRYIQAQSARIAKDGFKRALRHRFDDMRGDTTRAAFSEETSSIVSFIETLQNVAADDIPSVTSLWRGSLKSSRDSRFTKTFRTSHSRDDFDSADKVPIGYSPNDGIASDSEEDEWIPSRLLKGVSKRTKKLGGNMTGLLLPRPEGMHPRKQHSLAVEVEDVRRRHRRQVPLQEDYTSELRESASHSKSSAIPLYSPAETFTTLGEPDESPLATLRPPSMRRVVSDSHGDPHYLSRSTTAAITPPKASIPQRRRYSFDCEYNLPELDEMLSIQAMHLSAELQMTRYRLRQREKQLAKTVQTLTIIEKAYDDAIKMMEPPMLRRVNDLKKLNEKHKNFAAAMNVLLPESIRHREWSASSTQTLVFGRSEDAKGEIAQLRDKMETLNYNDGDVLAARIRSVADKWEEFDSVVGGSEILYDPSIVPTRQVGEIVVALQGAIIKSEKSGLKKAYSMLCMARGTLKYVKLRFWSHFRRAKDVVKTE